MLGRLFAILLISVSAAVPAVAGGVAPMASTLDFSGGTRLPSHIGESTRRDCGFDCLYEKANESQSLTAAYLVKKMTAIEKMSADDAKDELHAFCMPAEAAAACKKRYLEVQTLQLYKIRKQIIENSDMVARLQMHGAVAPNGQASPVYLVQEGAGFQVIENTKMAQAPKFETIDELTADYQREQGRLKTLVGYGYQRWAAELPPEPSRDDFVKFAEIPRDPQDPNSEKLAVIDLDANGKPKIDEDAYSKALADWKQKYELHKEELDAMAKDRPADRLAKTLKDGDGDVSIRAYNEAREEFVDTTNAKISGGGGSDAVYSGARGNGRSPSSDPDPNVQVLPVGRGADAPDVHVIYAPETLSADIHALQQP